MCLSASLRKRCPRHLDRATGFTLIELLVVFTLPALLPSLAVPRYLHSVDVAREKVRAQNLATLRDALDKFPADQGRFPNELAELVSRRYLRHIPIDPVTGADKWISLPHPAGLDAGVYDVAPPDPTTPPGNEGTRPGEASTLQTQPREAM